MLDGDRLVHNRSTTYDITYYEKVPRVSKKVTRADESIMDVEALLPSEDTPAASRRVTSCVGHMTSYDVPSGSQHHGSECEGTEDNPLFGTQDVAVEISPIPGISELSPPAPLVFTPVESCTPAELLPETDDLFYSEYSHNPNRR